MNSSNTIKSHQKQNHLYPSELFSMLDGKNRKMVIQSTRDPEKGFYVGKYLIEGINDFPQNTEIGLKFLEDSMEKGSTDSLFYICELLITKNDIIEPNLTKAIQLLQSYYDKSDPRYNYIYGLIYRKQRNDKKAFKCFQRSLSSGNSDAYFNYAEMLFYGNGCTKNKDKANEFFKKAKLNGCTKCDKYLTKNRATFQSEIKSPYKKSADIVFLLDGTESMNRFIQLLNFSEFCNKIIHKLWHDFPKVYFRFGVVLYADTAVTSYITNENVETVRVQFLTKRPSDIKRFLKNSLYLKGGYDGPEDWASGYESLLDKIEWDDKSEKIVIHICDSPGHGKIFSGDTLYLIPFFDKKNTKSMNQKIYDAMQEKEEEKFKNLIKKAASKNIEFFCLNLNSSASNCFDVTKDLFLKNDGKKFIVQDHFDVLDFDTFQKFVSEAVSSCLQNDSEVIEKVDDLKDENFDKKNDQTEKSDMSNNSKNDDVVVDENNSASDFDYEYEINKFFNSDDELVENKKKSDSEFDYEYEINKFFNSDDNDNESYHLSSIDEKSDDFKKKNDSNTKIELTKNDNNNDDDVDVGNSNNSDSNFDYDYEIGKFFNRSDNDMADNNNSNKSDSEFDYEYEINKFFNSEGDDEFDHGFSDDDDENASDVFDDESKSLDKNDIKDSEFADNENNSDSKNNLFDNENENENESIDGNVKISNE